MPAIFDLLLKNGMVMAAGGAVKADVAVRDGRVVGVGAYDATQAGEVFDATGLHVLPGVIDTEVRFREPGLEWKEDLESGSRAAVLGGVASVLELPNSEPPTTTPGALTDKLQRARGRMHCDHAFYAGASIETLGSIPELENLPGCCGISLFMGGASDPLLISDEDGIREVMRRVRRRLTVHAEEERRLSDRRVLARSGDWSSHLLVRDVDGAIAATQRLLRLVRETGRPVHVAHVTTAEEMELLAQAKDFVTVGVTPHHLTLEAPQIYETLKGFAQVNPPIREARHRQALWRAVGDGLADVLASSHEPHTREEKSRPYPGSPSGMPGVQTLLPVMLTHVAEGRLTLERLVDLTSAGPQRVFGIVGKGRIARGYDADFTVVDLAARRTITHADQATRSGWTALDGMEAKGWPLATFVRGVMVMCEGQLVSPGRGAPVRFAEALAAESRLDPL